MAIRFPSLDVILSGARRALLRFPFALATGAFCAAVAIVLVSREMRDSPGTIVLTRILCVAWLGIPLFSLLRVFAESRGLVRVWRDIVLPVSGVGVLLLMWSSFTSLEDRASLIRLVLWAMAIHFGVAFAPFTRRGSTNGFWQYNRFLLLRFVETYIYSVVLFSGLSLALVSIDQLLGIQVDKRVYGYLGCLLAFVFHPTVFLAGLPDDLQPLEQVREYPRPIEIFAQYILMPLVSLYVVILFAYLAKIVISMTWPKGMVGYLVSVAGVAGMLSILLLWPAAQGEQGKRWIARFSRAFFLALMPLSLLLLAAAYRRIAEYGLTEPRYLLFLFGLWLFGMAALFSFRRQASIKAIPVSLFVITLVVSVGPWGAYRVALSSQVARFQRELRANSLLENGRVRKVTAELPRSVRRQLSGGLDYFWERNQLSLVASLFPEGPRIETADPKKRARSWDKDYEPKLMLSSVGITYANSYDTDVEFDRYFVAKENDPLAVSGFDFVVRVNFYGAGNVETPIQKFDWKGVRYELRRSANGLAMTLRKNDVEVATVDLTKMVETLREEPAADSTPMVLQSVLTVQSEKSRTKVRLRFSNVTVAARSRPLELSSGTFDLLVKVYE